MNLIGSYTRKLQTGVLLLLFAAPQGIAQLGEQPEFEVNSAILDTSVLFAIGAREAQQALRGSFGWPTFQEGFVQGVYFRFDPDGYARFSPSPRLDEDVFEVICAQASTVCSAKKGALEISLTGAGQPQLTLSGLTASDTFFVSDKKSELPLPATILEPLDTRLEALLAAGGELIVRREVETVQSLSLAGFSAAVTYLRWVFQRQSPRVFPVGWPVPSQSQSQLATGLTQPDQWTIASAGPVQQPRNTPDRATSIGQASPQGVWPTLTEATSNPQDSNQLLQLQKQIAQLQNQLSIAGRQVLPVADTGQFVAAQDETQAFAQQAQGRNLTNRSQASGVTSPQYTAQSNQDLAQPRQWPNETGYASRPQSTPSMAINQRVGNAHEMVDPTYPRPSQNSDVLAQRLATMEQAMVQMQRDVYSQIFDLRRALQSIRELQINKPPALANRASDDMRPVAAQSQRQPDLSLRVQPRANSGTSPQQPNPQSPTTDALLSRLESQLLQRLAKQNNAVLPEQGLPKLAVQSDQGDTVSSNQDPDTPLSADRKLIEEILLELQSEAGPAKPASIGNGVLDAAPATSESDDFVTLSDYINGVLETEGLEQTSRQGR